MTSTPHDALRDIQGLLDKFLLPEASETIMTAAEQLREEGRKEGRKEGQIGTQRENLLILLNLRFGPLPEQDLARLLEAELTQLRQWFQRAATAHSLEAVFADQP